MQQPLRIIFAGTPHFAQAHLEALLAAGHQIVALFTQPDRAAGRGKKVTASTLKQFGQQHALPLFQPPSLRSAACEQQISDLQADVMVVVAYGLILPPTLLNKPRLGCINVHASLLPRWRGAAPIQRALLAGDRESGVTIMQMDAGLDTGAILSQVACPITADETSATLQSKLACIGPVTLLKTLQRLAQGTLIAQPQQNESATYAEKISKQEACLDWQQPAVVLEHAVRAFNPWPLSYFMMAGQTVKVWQAKALPLQTTTKGLQPIVPKTIVQADRFGIQVATTDGVLNLQQLQLPGRKPIAAYDLLNAHREWFIPGRLLD